MYVIKLSFLFLLAVGLQGLTFDADLAKEIYSYSRPTYCNMEKLSNWSCDPCQEHPKMQELQTFHNDTHQAQGYCGYDAGKNRIVIAVRGSDDFKNWQQNLNYFKTPYTGCKGCEVHRGFHNVYDDLANNLLACAYTLHSNHPNAQIFITGHSLGASQSAFAALEINSAIAPVSVFYNFGSPRVGNAAFAQHVDDTFKNIPYGRVTHWKDPFTHLPTVDQGFLHFGQEYFYNSDSSSFVICNAEDKTCTDQFYWPWQWVINDHLYYYGICAGCTLEACKKY